MGVVRKSKSIVVLLEVFNKSNNAISVVELIKNTSTQINKSTVYRALERMEQEGIIHSFNDKNGLLWYAKCNNCASNNHVDMHPHFQCKQCGSIECLPLEITIPKVENLQVDTAEIMLVGKCKDCLA